MNDRELFLKHMRQLGLTSKDNKPKSTIEDEDLEHDLFLKAMEEMDSPVKHIEKELPATPSKIHLTKHRPVAVEDSIDLHGMTASQALAALELFMKLQISHGSKKVLVITGKGKNSSGTSVLNPLVKSWIQKEGKVYVNSWAPAPRVQGGRGAFVIYLNQNHV